MTLHTRIVLQNPDVHPETVLAFINRELLHAPDAIRDDSPDANPFESGALADWHDRYYAGKKKVGNRIGQGLAAIAEVTYADPPGPITADADEEPVGPTGSMIVSFDTSYGYTENGVGCAELHAHYIVRLAREYGPLVWANEFTGEWWTLTDPDHPSLQEVQAFAGFGDPNDVVPGSLVAA